MRLLDKDGLPPASDLGERIVVKEFFTDRLGGTPDTFASLVNADRAECVGRAAAIAAMPKTFGTIPTLSFTIGRHSHAKCNGTGELQVGEEAKKLFAQEAARMAHPPQVKASLFVRLPVQWLGGCFQELWKRKGSRSLIKSYRDITLADLDGKDMGSFIRASIIGAVMVLAGPCQYGGGCNGGATDLCHLAVTQAMVLARAQSLSSATFC